MLPMKDAALMQAALEDAMWNESCVRPFRSGAVA